MSANQYSSYVSRKHAEGDAGRLRDALVSTSLEQHIFGLCASALKLCRSFAHESAASGKRPDSRPLEVAINAVDFHQRLLSPLQAALGVSGPASEQRAHALQAAAAVLRPALKGPSFSSSQEVQHALGLTVALSGSADGTEASAREAGADVATGDGKAASKLPPEILYMVASFVREHKYRDEARATLVNLSQTSRTWNQIAAPHLWTYPRDLDKPETQLRFAYAAALFPDLAAKVRTLRLRWLLRGVNGKLLEDIARSCPHTNCVLLHRGDHWDLEDPISQSDVDTLARVLAAFPHLSSLTIAKFSGNNGGQQQRRETVHLRYPAPLLERFKQLRHLALRGANRWMWPAVKSHLGPNLKEIEISQEVSLQHGDLIGLAERCPHLDNVYIMSQGVDDAELSRGIEMISPTLQKLSLAGARNNGDITRMRGDWLRTAARTAGQLKEVYAGAGTIARAEHLQDFTSMPEDRLESVALRDFDDEPDGTNEAELTAWQQEIDRAFVAFVSRHRSTLRDLHLYGVRIGSTALEALQQCSQLRDLDVNLRDGVPPEAVDALYEALPNLVAANVIARRGNRWEEWSARAKRVEDEQMAQTEHSDEILGW